MEELDQQHVPVFEIGDYVELKHNGKLVYGVIINKTRYGNRLNDSSYCYDILYEPQNYLFKDTLAIENQLYLLAKKDTVLSCVLKLVFEAHDGQVDLAGVNYLHHLTTVANIVKGQFDDENIIAVAYLHDILEDTKVDESQLRNHFSRAIVESVKVLTKPKYENYQAYLERVKSNEWARVVKLADLKHNSELSRITNRKITQQDKRRVEKYQAAMRYLEKIEGEDKLV